MQNKISLEEYFELYSHDISSGECYADFKKRITSYWERDLNSPPVIETSELDAFAGVLANEICERINDRVDSIKSEIQYKAQYVTEKVIELLNDNVRWIQTL